MSERLPTNLLIAQQPNLVCPLPIVSDVIDLGIVEHEVKGIRRSVHMVRFVMKDGTEKDFVASLHPQSDLAKFVNELRGYPIIPGETIDLAQFKSTLPKTTMDSFCLQPQGTFAKAIQEGELD